MRRLKRSTPLLQCSRNRLRAYGASLNELDFARTKLPELFLPVAGGCLAPKTCSYRKTGR
jgi:hypothetical protein